MMDFERPADLFDRVSEWSDLAEFAAFSGPGLRLAIMSGRRRQGKSYLLRRIARSADGFYHQAQEVGRVQALSRFADDIGARLGIGRGQLNFHDWETALRVALAYPDRGTDRIPGVGASGPQRMTIIDELPYLLEHSPEIPSVLQELYDESRDQGQYPGAAVILCGSALSVMSKLLSGAKALRGRAQLDLTLRPFDYLQARDYWGIADPAVAFQVDAVLGGTAGYRSLISNVVPETVDGVADWLASTALNPSHALFQETDYLLREDPRVSEKALYNSILSAVAGGQHTATGIGGIVGRDHNSLRYPLQILQSAGFLNRVEDILTQKRPLYYIADPIIRFAQVVIEPYRPLLEERDVRRAWDRAAQAFAVQVLGPHFEQLALAWTANYSGDRWGQELGSIGPAVVNDPIGKAQYQIDVLALDRNVKRADDKARIAVIGEAKSTKKPRTLGDLDRLDRIRELLGTRGLNVEQARLALFSREGFDVNLSQAAADRPDLHLIDLDQLYQARPR